MDGCVAVMHYDRADGGGEFDRYRALAVPTFFRSAQHFSVDRWYSACSGRHVSVAVLVLQAVAAIVRVSQTVTIVPGSPEVVEHVLEAIEVHDALDQPS
jgi:hypothetical protein